MRAAAIHLAAGLALAAAACQGHFAPREPCDDVTCSNHGLCYETDGGVATCLCTPGFHPDGVECLADAADADADVDSDVDGDADGDSDADADADGDTETEPTGTVVNVTLDAIPATSQPMATSVVLQPALACAPGVLEGVEIGLRATNALLSAANQPGLGSALALAVSPGCTVAPIRVSFPIAIEPYTATFEWSAGDGAPWTPMPEGVIEVGPLGSSVAWPLDGMGDVTVSVPPGLRAETVVLLPGCTDEIFDTIANAPASLALTDGALGSVLVAACSSEAWFYAYDDPVPPPQYQRLRPDVEDAEGPDHVVELLYVPAALGGGAERLLAAATASDTNGGGIYELEVPLDGEFRHPPARLVAGVQADAIAAVAGHASFTDGLYWADDGFISHGRFEGGALDIEPWSAAAGYRPSAISIAVGPGDVYGNLSMYVVRCSPIETSCDETLLDRVDASAAATTTSTELASSRPRLEASAGGIFGKLVYRVHALGVVIADPHETGPRTDLCSAEGLQLHDGAVYVPEATEGHYPPGFYLLASSDTGLRVIRIVQDLVMPAP